VREALKGTDAGVIDSTKQQLSEVLQRVGTRAYQEAPAGPESGDGAAPGEQPSGESEPESEETIEGEYKEV